MTIVRIFWKDAESMTTVGFIGSGQIGSTIARLAIDAGHHVVLSNSRGPATLADTVAELGPRASAATSGKAAPAGDIIVISVPVKAFPDMAAAPLAGKTVIDTCNYGPERDGHIPELADNSLTSSELLLSYMPHAMLVKAFNNVSYKHLLALGRPAGAAERSYLPIAGDSTPAKAAVTESIEPVGYSVVDAGPLADSCRQATGTPVWGNPSGPYSNEKGQPARTPSARHWPPRRGSRWFAAVPGSPQAAAGARQVLRGHGRSWKNLRALRLRRRQARQPGRRLLGQRGIRSGLRRVPRQSHEFCSWQ
jgi:8-hydroxy-5-deazaflavin:NADPH oxidoreductase